MFGGGKLQTTYTQASSSVIFTPSFMYIWHVVCQWGKDGHILIRKVCLYYKMKKVSYYYLLPPLCRVFTITYLKQTIYTTVRNVAVMLVTIYATCNAVPHATRSVPLN
jgi:hypothetical protein